MKPANNHSLFSHSELLPCLQVLKENAGEITYQALAERAQVGSRTKMKKIFKGELQIPKLALERLGETFGLNKEERCYLELLRNFEQASDPERSWCYGQKILQMRKKHHLNTEFALTDEQLCLLENWYTIPILHYFDMKTAQKDTASITKAFHGQLSENEVKKAVEDLLKHKLLGYSEDGAVIRTKESQTLLDDLPRPLLKKYHSMMIQKGLESMDAPRDRRFLLASTLPIKKSMVPLIRERLVQLIRDLDAQYTAKEAEEIHQLNIQFFQLLEEK